MGSGGGTLERLPFPGGFLFRRASGRRGGLAGLGESTDLPCPTNQEESEKEAAWIAGR